MSSENIGFDVFTSFRHRHAPQEDIERAAAAPARRGLGITGRVRPVPNPQPCGEAASGRVETLDGLRGFLALGVFLDHASIYQTYLRDGVWRGHSPLFTAFGETGVTLFFMITAYLFYGRLIVSEGRPGWLRHYIGRIFRIAPVYLVAIFAMFAVIAVASGFRLHVPAGQLANEVLCWLSLGAGPGVDINAYPDTRHLLAGVTWTLQSEWLFYASLPLLALAARRYRGSQLVALIMLFAGLAAALAFLAFFAPKHFPACVGPFFAGMCCAALNNLTNLPRLSDRHSSFLIVAIIALLFGTGIDPQTPLAILMLGCAFYLIVSGCTIFGLLATRTARWLSATSYGIYMLHGLVLSRLCAIPTVRALALSSPAEHWITMLAALSITLALASVAHVLVEQPGIERGRQVARALARRRASRPVPLPYPAPVRIEG